MSDFLTEALEGLPDRLREALVRVDKTITEAEGHLQELRAERGRIQRVLKAVEPDASWRRRRPAGSGPLSHKVSEEKIEQIAAYLREHIAEDETFYATGLVERDGWPYGSQSQTSYALTTLADRGMIRLDSYARGQGGAKIYRLTRRPSQ